jgi:hypothetical protein
MRLQLALAFLLLAVIGSGCGSNGESATERSEAQQRAAARDAQRAKRLAVQRRARQVRRAMAQARREAGRRQARREAARQRAREETEQAEAEEDSTESECDPNYRGACLDPYASDYDCEGGSGDGPLYTGPVVVVGEDHYGLDSDSDGSACEAY